VLGVALPAFAEERSGAISGYVRNLAGEPQMAATVQILGSADQVLTVFTDGSGHYSASGLLPGLYTLRVTAPSFLPALRERIGLRPGVTLNVNITLNTLLNVMRLGPVRTPTDEDDWKWTLRSVANRPVMRVVDDPPVIATSAAPLDVGAEPEIGQENPGQPKRSADLSGGLSFLAGSANGGYGSSEDMSTGFILERSMFADGVLAFSGNVGGEGGVPVGVFRTGYSNRLPDGSQPTAELTVRRFAPSDPNLHNAALQSLAFAAGDDFSVGDVLELRFGSELQTIEFLGTVNAVRPYGSADLHLSPNTVLEYAYTSSRPDPSAERGFDTAPGDLSESNPRISVLGYATKVEKAHHQEVSLSHRMGRNNLQLAVFSDRVGDPALTGMGAVTGAGGYLLPDVASSTFNYAGRNLDTGGVRVVLQRRFTADLSATLDYAYGGALDLTKPDVPLATAQEFLGTQRRHAVAAKLAGTMPRTHTRVIASYRWVNGPSLTPVDMFNASAGEVEPFFNVFIRQPIPTMGFTSGHVEAIIDVRNLLAQGYVPVLAQDGQTVYLVQSARSIRAGLAFTF